MKKISYFEWSGYIEEDSNMYIEEDSDMSNFITHSVDNELLVTHSLSEEIKLFLKAHHDKNVI